jgi:hypothetical protein
MASLLSRLVRRTTGMSIGESIGSSIGGAVGGTTGALIGKSVGGGITEAIDPNRTQQGQGVAVSQATQTVPQETQESGTTMPNIYQQFLTPASFSNLPLPPSTQQSGFQAANLPSMLFSGSAILGGAAAVIDLFFQDPVTGEVKRKKITRKFKSQVKQSVMLIGLEETANMLNTTPDIVVQILLKRFRNDGPYITKAAVRKTRSTVRKMEQVNMLTKEIAKLAGTTTTRRRATTGTRASTSRKTTVIQ